MNNEKILEQNKKLKMELNQLNKMLISIIEKELEKRDDETKKNKKIEIMEG